MTDATNPNPADNAFYLTLGEAARRVGRNKGTLSRAIKDGKLSGVRCTDTNTYKIDPAELNRYAEAVRVVRANPVGDAEPQRDATPDQPAPTPTVSQIELLEAKLAMADVQVADLRRVLDDVRADRDAWRGQAERLGMALPKPDTMDDIRPAPRGWWPWRRTG